MKGFKATNRNMACRDYQFELNIEFVHSGPIILCESGFHFCPKLQDVFVFYNAPDIRVFEIESSGDVVTDEIKCVTGNIRFVRELSIEELYEQCQHNWEVKRIAAYRQYKLDVLINDPYWKVRRQVAKQGYRLDILVNDPDWRVRRQVAEHGYGLEQLFADEDWNVRQLARSQLPRNIILWGTLTILGWVSAISKVIK